MAAPEPVHETEARIVEGPAPLGLDIIRQILPSQRSMSDEPIVELLV